MTAHTLYSVPSFGGHIVISHDVTTCPFLAMARTITDSYLVLRGLKTGNSVSIDLLPKTYSQKAYAKRTKLTPPPPSHQFFAYPRHAPSLTLFFARLFDLRLEKGKKSASTLAISHMIKHFCSRFLEVNEGWVVPAPRRQSPKL